MKRPPARVLDSVTVKQQLSAEELRRCTEVHVEFISGERILTSNSASFLPTDVVSGVDFRTLEPT